MTKKDMCIALLQRHGLNADNLMMLSAIYEDYVLYYPQEDKITFTVKGMQMSAALDEMHLDDETNERVLH